MEHRYYHVAGALLTHWSHYYTLAWGLALVWTWHVMVMPLHARVTYTVTAGDDAVTAASVADADAADAGAIAPTIATTSSTYLVPFINT